MHFYTESSVAWSCLFVLDLVQVVFIDGDFSFFFQLDQKLHEIPSGSARGFPHFHHIFHQFSEEVCHLRINDS